MVDCYAVTARSYPMPQTPAQRQAKYRQAHTNEPRLNTHISQQAKQALEALADRCCVTQREALEKALLDALARQQEDHK